MTNKHEEVDTSAMARLVKATRELFDLLSDIRPINKTQDASIYDHLDMSAWCLDWIPEKIYWDMKRVFPIDVNNNSELMEKSNFIEGIISVLKYIPFSHIRDAKREYENSGTYQNIAWKIDRVKKELLMSVRDLLYSRAEIDYIHKYKHADLNDELETAIWSINRQLLEIDIAINVAKKIYQTSDNIAKICECVGAINCANTIIQLLPIENLNEYILNLNKEEI